MSIASIITTIIKNILPKHCIELKRGTHFDIYWNSFNGNFGTETVVNDEIKEWFEYNNYFNKNYIIWFGDNSFIFFYKKSDALKFKLRF